MLHGCELSFSYAEATKNRLMETRILTIGSKEEEGKGRANTHGFKGGRRERRETDPELHQYWLVYSRNKTLLMKLKIIHSKSIIPQRLFSS
jgi:hypothetical protein